MEFERIIEYYFSGYKKIVRKLLRYADVNVQNINGETPLFYAVDGCQGEIFRELLKVDEIDVNIKNNDKETPLFRAVENCKTEKNVKGF